MSFLRLGMRLVIIVDGNNLGDTLRVLITHSHTRHWAARRSRLSLIKNDSDEDISHQSAQPSAVLQLNRLAVFCTWLALRPKLDAPSRPSVHPASAVFGFALVKTVVVHPTTATIASKRHARARDIIFDNTAYGREGVPSPAVRCSGRRRRCRLRQL